MASYIRNAALVSVCGLAGYLGPALFLGGSPQISHLATGLVTGAATGLCSVMAEAIGRHLPGPLQGLAGAGMAVFTWFPVTLTALFRIVPHLVSEPFHRFDLVWIGAGLAPVFLLGFAYLRASGPLLHEARWMATLHILFRFSFPLAVVQLGAQRFAPDKQHLWLAVFAAMMFLSLDLLNPFNRGGDDRHVSVD